MRGAREGLQVILVDHLQHLGGLFSSGMVMLDTQYEGRRAPLLHEFSQRVLDDYRTRYGEDSPQYKLARPPPRTTSAERMSFEPHVAEAAIEAMVQAEETLTVLKGYYPQAVERAERLLRAVVLAPYRADSEGETIRVAGRIFVDATYEGDLAALAGVPYHVGRESREQYGEPHAGRIFTGLKLDERRRAFHPQEALTGELNLRPFYAVTQEIHAGSTGEGDRKVQAYNYRLVLSRDPGNRRYPSKPDRYDRSAFLEQYNYNLRKIPLKPIPNQKAYWWQNFSGESDEYPTANWPRRREIMARHKDFALGMMYFLQNDTSVPEDERRKAREWGLAKDEFIDNDNFPYEMYIREARRIVGRYVFTEHDASLARGYTRTPIHEDSIAIAEWFMDSHEVSTELKPGSTFEGKVILSELTRPSQIPYRALLPKNLDNLLVPVCLSASHVAWGTIRLEPTWMHIGEAAGFAAALAHKTGTLPGRISPSQLQRELVENGLMISFFNDVDMKDNPRWTPAVQYLGARGFFDSYQARPDALLELESAQEWARAFGELAADRGEPSRRARSLFQRKEGGHRVSAGRFEEMLSTALSYWNVEASGFIGREVKELELARDEPISRGDACALVYRVLGGIQN